jgi:hypothetical protein
MPTLAPDTKIGELFAGVWLAEDWELEGVPKTGTAPAVGPVVTTVVCVPEEYVLQTVELAL